MYDLEKRKLYQRITVEELIQELRKFNPKAQVVCCGDDYVTLHIETDSSVVCIDNEDLDECYEEYQ